MVNTVNLCAFDWIGLGLKEIALLGVYNAANSLLYDYSSKVFVDSLKSHNVTNALTPRYSIKNIKGILKLKCWRFFNKLMILVLA